MPKGFWWIVEIASLSAYLIIPAVILNNYSALPATIPTHYGISGAPDGYGDKSTLLFVMGVSTFVFVLISATPFFPQLINLPVPVTSRNTQTVISMTRLLKLETMTFLAFLSWRMVETSQGLARGLGGFAPITFVTALLLTIGAGLFRAIRNE